MAQVRRLTAADLAFVEQIEGLSVVLAKLKLAKALIDEARELSKPILAGLRAPAAKAKAKAKVPEISYGVDVPPALTDDQRAVRDAAPTFVSKNEIQAKTKLPWGRLDRTLYALRKRGLMKATGNTTNRRWKAI